MNIPKIGDKIIRVRTVDPNAGANIFPVEDSVVDNMDILDELDVLDEPAETVLTPPPVVAEPSVSATKTLEDALPSVMPTTAPQEQDDNKEYSIKQFKNDYNEKFHNQVIPMLADYDNERKKRLVGAIAASTSIVIIAILYICFSPKISGDLVAALFGAAAGSWYLIKKSFEKKIKRKVMPVLMKAIPDFYWQEKPPVTVEDMAAAKIFPLIPKCKVTSDDCFLGKYRDVTLDITECTFTYGKKDVFEGAVIKIKMNKDFEGLTVIRPKKNIDFPYVKDLQKAKLEKIELEDTNFNKIYHTFSTDQVEARYLLTTSFMERFKNITMAFDSKVAFCAFQGKHVYIAPYCKKDLFSIGSLIKPITDEKQFMQLFNELVSILELVDHFKLDKKLGL